MNLPFGFGQEKMIVQSQTKEKKKVIFVLCSEMTGSYRNMSCSSRKVVHFLSKMIFKLMISA
jgi:hypothetical protein